MKNSAAVISDSQNLLGKRVSPEIPLKSLEHID
jgi:hypothetical protein